MNHFSTEDCINLVRGTLPRRLELSMQDHLKGCPSCEETFEFWRSVARVASREHLYQPPPELVRTVKAEIGARILERERSRSVSWVQLVFDSLKEPLSAGVRALGRRPRQLLYEGEGFSVDLRVESQRGQERSLVIGQILRSPGGKPPEGLLPVTLRKGSVAADCVVTNRHGEFRMEVALERGHVVRIDLDDDRSLELAIDVPEEESDSKGLERGTE